MLLQLRELLEVMRVPPDIITAGTLADIVQYLNKNCSAHPKFDDAIELLAEEKRLLSIREYKHASKAKVKDTLREKRHPPTWRSMGGVFG